MANQQRINAATYVELAAQAPDQIPIIFSRMTLARSRQKDVFKALAGKMGKGKSVVEVYEAGKGKNDKIRFTNHSGVGMPAVIGSGLRTGKSGKVRFGGFEVKLDWKHGSVAMDRKHENLLDIEFQGLAMEVLGDWFAQLKQDEAYISLKKAATSDNTLYANNKTSINALRTADVLSTSLVDTNKLIMEGNGAVPVDIGKDDNNNEVNQYLFLTNHIALAQLAEGNGYVAAQLNAAPRSKDNVLFSGGFSPWNGSIIMRHQLIDEPCRPVGSPQAPKAWLSEAIAGGTTAVVVKGGRYNGLLTLDPQPNWFGCFENFNWQFFEGQTDETFSTPRYFLIINVKTDGLVGMYEYITGNNGSTITITKRLGATDSGFRYATVGNVTWETGVWATGGPGGVFSFLFPHTKCTKCNFRADHNVG